MGLVLALGVAGVFGDGRLVRRTVRAGDAHASLQYERVARAHAAQRLVVEVHDGAGDTTTLALPASLLAVVALDGVTPEPAAARATPAGLELAVAHAGGARRGRIAVRFTPSGPARVRDTVRVDGAPLPLDLLVLP